MHIVFITDEYPKKGKGHGGIGTMVYMLAHAMHLNGHTISIIGQNNDKADDETEDNGIRVIRVAKSMWPAAKFADYAIRLNKRLRRLHREQPIDIIEAPELSFGLTEKISGVSYIIRLNGGHHFFTKYENRPREKKKVWMEKRAFAICDAIIGVSQFVYDITKSEVKFDKPHTIISNPIDTSAYAPDPSVLVDRNLLVFAGTIVEKKGVRQLVLAMPKVLKLFPNIRLELYGRDWQRPDGSSYSEYLKTFIAPQFSSQILLKGEITRMDLKTLLLKAGICIFPSHMEAMPLVWLEALGLGKAILASETGPGKEVISNGKTGILINPHNPDSIADGLITLLKDPALCERLGKAAREDAIKRFSLQSVAEKSIAFYQQVKSAKYK